MGLKMSGEMAGRLERWGVIQKKQKIPEKNVPETEYKKPFNRKEIEKELMDYGDSLHEIVGRLREALALKKDFFKRHPEIPESEYENLKQGAKPDFDKHTALIHGKGGQSTSPDEIDVNWSEETQEFADILKDIIETCAKHPEMKPEVGEAFLSAVDDFLKKHTGLSASNLESQTGLLAEMEKINNLIEVQKTPGS